MTKFNIDKIRADFPVLSKIINNQPLIYLDNAASTQKPYRVIKREHRFLSEEYANVSRGAYTLAMDATTLFEKVRKKAANFIGADNPEEIIFTSGATQSINLVAYSYARNVVQSGDEIIISVMEHHSNIIPWQIVCEEKGAVLRVIPINDQGELIMEEFDKLLNKKTRIVAITHVSNVLGTINPIKEIISKAHSAGARVLIDGAQSAPHIEINVKEYDCDFFVFSGHKMFGPSGVGILYGKMDILESMPPYMTGGGMIMSVTLKKSAFAKPPARFEAGTPPISQVIGLGEAIDYLNEIGMDSIEKYERDILAHGTDLLKNIIGLKIIGTAEEKTSILSFFLKEVHPHDAVTLLDQDGIAVRGGHHCAQPVMERFGIPAAIRVSLAFYNTREELNMLADSLLKAIKVFS